MWGVDLKNGMELQPWASCLGRLATTPAEADALLSDAVRLMETRAEQLAAEGGRVWEPTPDRPALVIVIDEYAELAETAADALAAADSIARRGRAPSVTLIVATQRPTQQAMGSGAVRSQMEAASACGSRNAATSTSSSARACSPPAGPRTCSTAPASSSSPPPALTCPAVPSATSSTRLGSRSGWLGCGGALSCGFVAGGPH